MVVNSILSIFCVPFCSSNTNGESCRVVIMFLGGEMRGIQPHLLIEGQPWLCTLKIELPPPEVIQDLRTVCHESLAEPTHRRIAAQRQPANTRSERAQEMIRQRGKYYFENCCKKESPGRRSVSKVRYHALEQKAPAYSCNFGHSVTSTQFESIEAHKPVNTFCRIMQLFHSKEGQPWKM